MDLEVHDQHYQRKIIIISVYKDDFQTFMESIELAMDNICIKNSVDAKEQIRELKDRVDFENYMQLSNDKPVNVGSGARRGDLVSVFSQMQKNKSEIY